MHLMKNTTGHIYDYLLNHVRTNIHLAYMFQACLLTELGLPVAKQKRTFSPKQPLLIRLRPGKRVAVRSLGNL